MDIINRYRCFDGEQQFYRHTSQVTGVPMQFGLYLPPQALAGQACPLVMFLAGLTCNEETFAIKAHAQQTAATLGLILLTPDTSPRGEAVAVGDHWDIGQGAGFYLDATQAPWQPHFQMERYLLNELLPQVRQQHAVTSTSIMGHSMGGHGALTLGLRHSQQFAALSAIAPICAPMDCPWGQKAFRHYLGDDQAQWADHDATRLISQPGKAGQFDLILIDQGRQDQFLGDGSADKPHQLLPERFEQACQQAGQPLILRWHAGYDHGYYFIQSVIADHLYFHHQRHMQQCAAT